MQQLVCFGCKTELKVPSELMSRRITCLRCGRRVAAMRDEESSPEPEGRWQVIAVTAVTALLVGITWLILATRPSVLIGTVATVLLVGVGFLIYFAPTVLAFVRGHQNRAAILAVNFLVGWTFIGWVATMVWSVTARRSRHSVHYHYH